MWCKASRDSYSNVNVIHYIDIKQEIKTTTHCSLSGNHWHVKLGQSRAWVMTMS